MRARLVAKVDSAAVQDGFDLYLHGFFVTADGKVDGRPAGHERRQEAGAPLSLAFRGCDQILSMNRTVRSTARFKARSSI